MEGLIRLRELNMTDVNKLYEIYSDKEAMKFRGSKPMKTLIEARNFVKNKRSKNKNKLTIREGIELLKTGELIGSVMYKYDENKKKECEIGYSIGRQFWGQGLGKEIINTMIKAIEEKCEIKNIVAWSNENNIASIKILERLGFMQIEQNEHIDCRLYLKKIQ